MCPKRAAVALIAALVLLAAAGLVGGGCARSSGRSVTSAELRLERAQLMLVSEGLRAARAQLEREVDASRAVWPQIAKGLPRSASVRLRLAIAHASASAGQLAQPSFLAHAGQLTGPAAGLASLYETFARLAQRSWELTGATVASIAHGPPPAARFARANSSLYIDAIYDAHFDLSLLGKELTNDYERLGGQRAFGAKLDKANVEQLARAYSIAAVRLAPHPSAQ
jgi:hypothetical protein